MTVSVVLPAIGTAYAWRTIARDLAARNIAADAIEWRNETDNENSLFGEPYVAQGIAGTGFSVPRAFVELANAVICHSDPQRFALLYRALLRVRKTPPLIHDRSDREIATLRNMEKSVGRDCHKMRAFVRFREIGSSQMPRRRFAAWFEPDHFIVERNAPFFVRRFGDMDWLIATPKLCAHFENGCVAITPGIAKPDIADDPADELWCTYFSNIFNPARLKVKAMQSEMPKKYWRNLPEARLIPELIAGAERRVMEMRANQPTLPPLRAHKIKARTRD